MRSLRLHCLFSKFESVGHNDDLLGSVVDNNRWAIPNVQAPANILDQMDIACHDI